MSKEIRAQDIRADICRLLVGRDAWSPGLKGDEYLQAFVNMANDQRVSPLITERLKIQPQSTDIKYLMDALSPVSQVLAAFSLGRQAALESLRQSFDLAGIPAVLFKGSALAHTLYQQPHHRAAQDSDLFIDLKQIPAVIATLSTQGFSIYPPIYKSHQFIAVRKVAGGAVFAVDVHWRINNASQFARSLSFATVSGAATENPAAAGWAVPDPVHSLLVACMHLVANPGHDRERLIWLYDIFLLVQALDASQRERFLSMSRQQEALHAACQSAISATADLFPDSDVDYQWALSELPPAEPPTGFSSSQLALVLADLRELPGLREQWGLVRELFFPDGAYLLQKYDKQQAAWLPVLYFRYLFSGLARRLSFR